MHIKVTNIHKLFEFAILQKLKAENVGRKTMEEFASRGFRIHDTCLGTQGFEPLVHKEMKQTWIRSSWIFNSSATKKSEL